MWETWVQSLDREDTLEEEMATHSSILGWRIPWAEEPGVLQSMGPQGAGHNVVTEQHFIHSSVYMLIPISILSLSPPVSLGSHKFVFYVYDSISVL